MLAVANKIGIIVVAVIFNLKVDDTLVAVAVLEAFWDIAKFNPCLIKAGVDAALLAVEDSGGVVLHVVNKFLLVDSNLEFIFLNGPFEVSFGSVVLGVLNEGLKLVDILEEFLESF